MPLGVANYFSSKLRLFYTFLKTYDLPNLSPHLNFFCGLSWKGTQVFSSPSESLYTKEGNFTRPFLLPDPGLSMLFPSVLADLMLWSCQSMTPEFIEEWRERMPDLSTLSCRRRMLLQLALAFRLIKSSIDFDDSEWSRSDSWVCSCFSALF